mmetsp:Transcript_3521/g.5298  ORF Transcript_3521/g.5298 Transcript_3521/m.5298 type:complete len:496 (+) Transcript_3521:23-1510(+)
MTPQATTTTQEKMTFHPFPQPSQRKVSIKEMIHPIIEKIDKEVDDDVSLLLDEIEAVSMDLSSSQLTMTADPEVSEALMGSPGINRRKFSKTHRRRSLELSCMSLKIDLAESCTTLDTVRNELAISQLENEALGAEVETLETQMSEMRQKVSEQADLIRRLKRKSKEWALEKVNLRVQVESLQAECSRHKLETRRFADESARATEEAKEMNDIVNFMRVHTERIIFEKEEYKKQLSVMAGEETVEEVEGMHQSQQQKIRNWFGGKSEKEYTQEENRKYAGFQQEEADMEEESEKTQKVSSKKKKENAIVPGDEEAEERQNQDMNQNNDTELYERKMSSSSQDSSSEDATSNIFRGSVTGRLSQLLPPNRLNRLASHLKSPEQQKRTRKSLFGSILSRDGSIRFDDDDDESTICDDNKPLATHTEAEIEKAEVITNENNEEEEEDQESNASSSSNQSENSQSLSELSFKKIDAHLKQYRASVTVKMPSCVSFARQA